MKPAHPEALNGLPDIQRFYIEERQPLQYKLDFFFQRYYLLLMPEKKAEGSTKEKLISAAKEEFLKNGFQKASLRTICTNAGVTTGALYFFFKDKEELFDSIVQPVMDEITSIVKEHFSYEDELIGTGKASLSDSEKEADLQSDLGATLKLCSWFYSHYDEFILAVTKSQGTKWERCLDFFIDWNYNHLKAIADSYCKETGKEKIDSLVIRMISHSQINCLVNILLKIPSYQEAEKYIPLAVKYLVGGWDSLFK